VEASASMRGEMLDACESPLVLPADIACASTWFRVEAYRDDLAHDLGIQLPDALAHAVPKRRAEYVAGRVCALAALKTICPDFAGAISSDSDRAPCWPPGLIGSITHTNGFASAAVAPSERARSIGLDAEHILSSGSLQAVREIAVRDDDPAPESVGLADEVFYALLFSAKESVFKCLYPLVRRMFDFKDVRLEFVREAQTFSATVLATLGAEFEGRLRAPGRYAIHPPLVHTGLLLEHRR
jgi:enterobactin synthetase component D